MAGSDDEQAVDAQQGANGGGPPVVGGVPAAGGAPVEVDLKVKLKKRCTAVKGWATRAKNNALALF